MSATDQTAQTPAERARRYRLRKKVAISGDLAVAIRDNVYEKIEAGRLSPTVAHGLAAQALLDKRDQRTDDKKTLLAFARLLSGAAGDNALAPVAISGEAETEGEFTELEE